MEKIKFFEDAVEKLNVIKQTTAPGSKERDAAEDAFYDGLEGWKFSLFNKYYDAIGRQNHYIDFDNCPSAEETWKLVACMQKLDVLHITISSEWSGLVGDMWEFCRAGCSIEGMVEINDRHPNRHGNYDKKPAFLLRVGTPKTKEENKT